MIGTHSTANEIEKGYKALSLKIHPDKNVGLGKEKINNLTAEQKKLNNIIDYIRKDYPFPLIEVMVMPSIKNVRGVKTINISYNNNNGTLGSTTTLFFSTQSNKNDSSDINSKIEEITAHFIKILKKKAYLNNEGKSMIDCYYEVVPHGKPHSFKDCIGLFLFCVQHNDFNRPKRCIIEETLNSTHKENMTFLYWLLQKKDKSVADIFNIVALLSTDGVDVNKHPKDKPMAIELLCKLTKTDIKNKPSHFTTHQLFILALQESFKDRGLDSDGLEYIDSWKRAQKMKKDLAVALLVVFLGVCLVGYLELLGKIFRDSKERHLKLQKEAIKERRKREEKARSFYSF